jgi:hypothetical protein
MAASLTALLIAGATAVALCGDMGAIGETGSIGAVSRSRTEVMAFSDCISLVDEISSEMGVKPVSLLRTADVWLSRLDASDGAVTITCSRPERRVTLKRYMRAGVTPDQVGASVPGPKS